MDKYLQQLANDSYTLEALKAFMKDFIKERAGEMAILGQEVTGIKEANRLIGECFSKIEEIYKFKKESKDETESR